MRASRRSRQDETRSISPVISPRMSPGTARVCPCLLVRTTPVSFAVATNFPPAFLSFSRASRTATLTGIPSICKRALLPLHPLIQDTSAGSYRLAARPRKTFDAPVPVIYDDPVALIETISLVRHLRASNASFLPQVQPDPVAEQRNVSHGYLRRTRTATKTARKAPASRRIQPRSLRNRVERVREMNIVVRRA